MVPGLTYFCDNARHLVCVPYSIENLHLMARDLGIKQCWFHQGASHPHYDVPKRRVAEVKARCTVVSSRVILLIAKGMYGGGEGATDDSQSDPWVPGKDN